MEIYLLIGIYVICLLLSIALGMLISKFIFQKPIFSTVTLLACVILFSLLRRFVVPEIKEMISPDIVQIMQTQPLFHALKDNEPEVYQYLIQTLKNNNIKSEEQALAIAQSRIQNIMRNRIGKAQDTTVSQFFKAMENQLRALEVYDDLCLRQFSMALTPKETQLIIQTYEQTGIEVATIELLNDPLSRAKPSESSVLPEIRATYKSLTNRYGKSQISLIEYPERAANIEEKQLVCNMLADMYATLNDPNDKQKMATLRFLFSIPK